MCKLSDFGISKILDTKTKAFSVTCFFVTLSLSSALMYCARRRHVSRCHRQCESVEKEYVS